MPHGDVDVSGKLAFKGLAAKDLNNLGDMLKKTEADFNMSVPQKLLEQLAVNQASSLFSVNAEMKPQAAPASTISTRLCA